jgi:hypothetical protein
MEISGMQTPDITQAWDALDWESAGRINYTEYIAASLD